MYNTLSQRFQNCLETEIHRDASEVYPLEVFERSASEINFYNLNYRYFNEIWRSLSLPEAPFYCKKRTLNDIVLSLYKKNTPCLAEVNLANNFTLKNIALLRLHKGLKFTTFHRVNSYLEDWCPQTYIISCLNIPYTLRKSLFELQKCERHSNLIVERPLKLKSCLRYRIIPGTQAYEQIIVKFNAFESKLTLSLLDSFSIIEEIKLLTHSTSEATNLFYENVNTMKKYVFKEI